MLTEDIKVAYNARQEENKTKYTQVEITINNNILKGLILNVIDKANMFLEDILFELLNTEISNEKRFNVFISNNSRRYLPKKKYIHKEDYYSSFLKNGGSICVSDNDNPYAEIRTINLNDFYNAAIKFYSLYSEKFDMLVLKEDEDANVYLDFINYLLYGN